MSNLEKPKRTREVVQKEAVQMRHDHALALGMFSIEFAEMENKINCAIHELLGLEPNTGHALTSAIMNVSTRLDIFGTLGRDLELPDEDRELVLKAAEDAFELNSFRNWLLHEPWSGSTRSSLDPVWKHGKRRMRPKGQSRDWQYRHFTDNQILGESYHCRRVARALVPLLSKLATARVARKKKLDEAVEKE
jgi:hypothetical protein